MSSISIQNIVSTFNHSDMRRKIIPQELVSGWPSLKMTGKTLCITIPYYSRIPAENKFYLNPIYCSVTFPIGNPDRLMDFTIYPHQTDWADVDYSKPAGYFKHEALSDVKTKGEYQALCNELFKYYDKMAAAIMAKKPFQEEDDMRKLFSRLMEPGHYPQYLKINKKFYSYFSEI